MKFFILALKCTIYGIAIGSITQLISTLLNITDNIPSDGAIIATILSAPGYLLLERCLQNKSAVKTISKHHEYHKPVYCHECQNLMIIKDTRKNIRSPHAYCLFEFPVTNTVVMEWEPTNSICNKYKNGDPQTMTPPYYC